MLLETNGARALERSESRSPDLMVLDLMLPGLDGPQVCRRLCQKSAMPIIMTTAKDEEIDRLLGLDLTPTEFRLLSVLSGRPGRVFSRAQILELAYADEHEIYDRVIDSHVKNLRRKLTTAGMYQSVIRSVYGVGYSFDGTTRKADPKEDRNDVDTACLPLR